MVVRRATQPPIGDPGPLDHSLFNPIVIALTGWLVALFASRLGYSQRLSVGLGLAYALCTMVLPYTGTYFSEPLIALLILLAVYAVYAARGGCACAAWLIVAGASLGLAVFIRERSAIMIPPFILYVYLCQRRVLWRGWVAFFAPLVMFAARSSGCSTGRAMDRR